MKLLSRMRAKMCIRAFMNEAHNINADQVAERCGVSVYVVHQICRRYVDKGYLQRLHNTAGSDYYPIGLYGGMARLPHPDGAKNPFLTDSGRLRDGLLPPEDRNTAEVRGNSYMLFPSLKDWPDPPPTKRPVNYWAIDAGRD